MQFSDDGSGTGALLKEMQDADKVQGARRPMANCITARTAYCKGQEYKHMADQYGCKLDSAGAALESAIKATHQRFNDRGCEYGTVSTLDDPKANSVTPDCGHYGFK